MASEDKDGNWTTTVGVLSQEQYDKGPFHFGESYNDGSLDRVIEALNAIRDSIPEEYRAVARCEISSLSGYEGSHCANIDVKYSRPATGDEITATADYREAARIAEVHRLHAQLDRLNR